MKDKGNDRWAALSMKDRAALIRMFIQQGITKLSDIRTSYNALSEGGSLDSYEPFLEGGAWAPQSSNHEVTIPYKQPATSGPIDRDEIARRQRYAESSFNDKAVNNKSGAAGAYQIMPISQKQFEERNNRVGDIFDYRYNKEIRDYLMNWYSERPYLQAPTDSVAMGKQLAAFNAGQENVRRRLNKAKKDGVDIEDSFDWLEYMKPETRDYVNFILRNKDVSKGKNNNAYRRKVESLKNVAK